MTPSEQVIHFWFSECKPAQWFSKDSAFDASIRERFATCHEQASRCELFSWRDSALGRLAEIIVLDQFSRNLFRDRPEAFAQDPLALGLAQEAVRSGADRELELSARAFLYMPYMHSESVLVHEQAVLLYKQPGLEYNYEFELKHRAIIIRFGRYPHRNRILGRPSTPAEEEFLRQPGSSF